MHLKNYLNYFIGTLVRGKVSFNFWYFNIIIVITLQLN